MTAEEEATSELVVVDVRRYRNVKKALRASEERFRALFENLPIGLYRTTEDGVIVDANPAFVAMLGFSSRDELSASHRSGDFYVVPERCEEILDHLRRHGVIHGADAVLRCRDGREITVRQNITLIHEPRDTACYLEGSVEDITGVLRSQEADLHHARQTEVLNRVISAGHQTRSLGDFLARVQPILLDFSGLDAGGIYLIDDIKRQAVLAVSRNLPADFEQAVRVVPIDEPPYERVCLRGEVIVWQEPAESTPKGPTQKYWHSGASFPLWAGERVVGVMNLASVHPGAFREVERELFELIGREMGNIIAKFQVEAELKRSERLFRAIFESIPQMACIFRREGGALRLINFNRAAIENNPVLKERNPLNADMSDFWGQDSPYPPLVERMFSGLPLPEEVLYRSVLSGREWWLKVSAALLDADTLLVVASDVTEQHRAAGKLEEYQQQLRQLTLDLSLTAEKERRRIAADLHDHLGQKLVLAKMTLQSGQSRHNCEGGDAEIEQVVGLLDEALRDTRSLIFDLSPPVLYELGFVPALEWLGEQTEEKYGIPVTIEVHGEAAQYDERITVTLFQIARELLVNVGKHSRARQARVELHHYPGSLVLTIVDDGAGFDPGAPAAPPAEGGYGLFSVRERLSPLGGTMTIRSRPGEGATVVVEVPASLAGEVQ